MRTIASMPNLAARLGGAELHRRNDRVGQAQQSVQCSQ